MSYKLVLIEGNGHECSSGVRFAAAKEADDSHGELWRRWTCCPTNYRVAKSDDPVSYRMVDGRPRSLRSLEGGS